MGPLLFLMFVNELPYWIKNEIRMFADDTKIWCRIKTETDSATLQEDLDNLIAWSNTWQLKSNAEKYKVMHIGHSCKTDYFMADGSTEKRKLATVPEERDLGIIIRADLKPSSQCNESATTARRIIGMVRRNFKYLDIEDFKAGLNEFPLF